MDQEQHDVRADENAVLSCARELVKNFDDGLANHFDDESAKSCPDDDDEETDDDGEFQSRD